jgi:hypothetical protein
VFSDLAVADPEDVDLADRVSLAAGGRPRNSPNRTAWEVSRTATLSPSAITSSMVMLTSDKPAETRLIACFRSALPPPVEPDV